MDQALRLAFDLVQLPSQVRFVRGASLPNDVPFLLGIAAGDERLICQAVQASGQSHAKVAEAAAFFIEQILLFPDADSYRVLGSTPLASNAELRRNMALLLRWLHPDLDPRGERSVYARKVTRAWNDLKTPERRAAYDRSISSNGLVQDLSNKERGRNGRNKGPARRLYNGHIRHGTDRRFSRTPPRQPLGLLRRVLILLLGRTAY